VKHQHLSTSSPRLIAFYLPQFHPTPENDRWWGKGFTEWTNVAKATPLFEGHYQPHLPGELGFYDLRLGEIRRQQIDLARQHGIDGFCYYYYWFSGTRLLNRPLDDMLNDHSSDMPFCLCWANEDWTRRWDAADHDVLIAQRYLPADPLEFINSLIPFFRDGRYIQVDGKPLLIVYRVQHMPDPIATANAWRHHCRSLGIGEIHLCAALTHGNQEYRRFGFDSGVEFPPHNLGPGSTSQPMAFRDPFFGSVLQYDEVADSFLQRRYQDPLVYRTVFPGWDNSARVGSRALVVLNSTPANYEYWLAATLRHSREREPAGALVFINAWNEWAEGCHLEPDRQFGREFLEATHRAVAGESTLTEFRKSETSPGAGASRSFFGDILSVCRFHGGRLIGALKRTINRHPQLRRLALWLLRMLRKLGAT
jgi:lipopolysaccharide biosynthesis protein